MWEVQDLVKYSPAGSRFCYQPEFIYEVSVSLNKSDARWCGEGGWGVKGGVEALSCRNEAVGQVEGEKESN